MKNLLLAVLLFTFTSSFGQITTTNDQLFGGTRTVEKSNFHDFGIISENTQYEFIVTNTNKVPITLTTSEIPQAYSVVIVDKVIKPNSLGKVIIKVFPEKIINKGDFEQEIKIISEYEAFGEKQTNDIIFKVKGKIQ